ncbi:MAG: hypothetical protein ACLQOO_25815 [Terriglobia bacterium]
MMTFESTVLEKLFHDDHPIGGGVTGICLALDGVCWFEGGAGGIISAAANDDGDVAATVFTGLVPSMKTKEHTSITAVPQTALTYRSSISPPIRMNILLGWREIQLPTPLGREGTVGDVM